MDALRRTVFLFGVGAMVACSPGGPTHEPAQPLPGNDAPHADPPPRPNGGPQVSVKQARAHP